MTSGAARLPMLGEIAHELASSPRLAGRRVLLNMHLTRETVALAKTFGATGASLAFFGSNRTLAVPAIAQAAQAQGALYGTFDEVAAFEPAFVVEGNGRVFLDAHKRPERWPSLAGISMHTSGGGAIVDATPSAMLRIPVVAVYRDSLKQQWETGLGTSQSVLAALLRGLKRPLAGHTALVVGFGNVGSGVARALRAVGARVIVAEVRDEAQLRARFEGFRVAAITDALAVADLCITTTGRPGVIRREQLAGARTGLVLANVSNEPREIDLDGCVAGGVHSAWLEWWHAGRVKVQLLGGGTQVNHVVEEGNPSELMDLSFSLHALVVPWLAEATRAPGVHEVPDEIHCAVAARYARHLR
jgi:adenosylhomocysteinase